MDEAIEFARKYIDADFNAEWSKRGDPEESYRRRLAELSVFLDAGIPSVSRMLDQTPEELAEMVPQRKTVAKRTLFEVRQADHPTLGACYFLYLSRPTTFGGTSCEELVVAARRGGALKIVTRFRFQDGEWAYASGERLGKLKVKDRQSLAQPQNPASLEDGVPKS